MVQLIQIYNLQDYKYIKGSADVILDHEVPTQVTFPLATVRVSLKKELRIESSLVYFVIMSANPSVL